VLLQLDGKGMIARAAIALAGVGSRPLRITAGEQVLLGKKPTPELFAEAASHATRIDATTDVHASAEYRQHLGGVMTRRALTAALPRAQAHG
jgi:aerobic carbon-monoxide dehydrogenase medium subunit